MSKNRNSYGHIISSEQDLGTALSRRRKSIGVTQKQLADFCNLSHNGISQIELGNKSARLSTLIKLGKLLGLKLVLIEEDRLGAIVRRNREIEIVSFLATQGLRNSKKMNDYYVRTYGITLEQYGLMLKSQNGVCALSDGTCSTERKPLAVDHDHGSGKVRGLLCTKHNTGLGKIEKKLTHIREALSYLKRSGSIQE